MLETLVRGRAGRVLAAALAMLMVLGVFPLVGTAFAVADGPTVSIDTSGLGEATGTQTIPVSVTGFGDVSEVVAFVSVPHGTLAIVNSQGLTLEHGYGSFTGVPSIGFRGTTAAVSAALAGQLQWTAPSGGERPEVELSVSVAERAVDTFFNPANGHYYLPVTSASNISFGAARNEAAARELFGMSGYLATVTSAEENGFVGSYVAAEDIWIGASDAAQEGRWTWVTGPEQGMHFWEGVGGAGGYVVSGRYASWAANEPNDYGTGEDYAVTNWTKTTGAWNDLAGGQAVQRYLVEFGGMSGETSTATRASTAATISRYKPTAPSYLSAWAGHGEVSLHWSTPLSDGGSPITGYEVNKVVGGVSTPVCAVSSTWCDVPDLKLGVPVHFTVAAINDVGTGAAQTSTSVTPIPFFFPDFLPMPLGDGPMGVPFNFGRGPTLLPLRPGLPTTGTAKSTIDVPGGILDITTERHSDGRETWTDENGTIEVIRGNADRQLVLDGAAPTLKAALNAAVSWEAPLDVYETVVSHEVPISSEVPVSEDVAVTAQAIDVDTVFLTGNTAVTADNFKSATVSIPTESGALLADLSNHVNVNVGGTNSEAMTFTGTVSNVTAALDDPSVVSWKPTTTTGSTTTMKKMVAWTGADGTTTETSSTDQPLTHVAPKKPITDFEIPDVAGEDALATLTPTDAALDIETTTATDGTETWTAGPVKVTRDATTGKLVLDGPAPSVQAALNAAVSWSPTTAPVSSTYTATIGHHVVLSGSHPVTFEHVTGVPTGPLTATLELPAEGGALWLDPDPQTVNVTGEGTNVVVLQGEAIDVVAALSGTVDWQPGTTAGKYPLSVVLDEDGGTFATTLGVELVASGPPQAPTELAATHENGDITVTWKAPAYDGGAAITDYAVTLETTNQLSLFVPRTATTGGVASHTFAGIEAAEGPFQITVRADNGKLGDAEIAAVTPGRPDAPVDVVVTTHHGVATVTWKAPVDTGGALITEYVVEALPVDDGATGRSCTWIGGPLSCTIDGLTPAPDLHDEYTFRVTARNRAGAGLATMTGPVLVKATVPAAPVGVAGYTSAGSATVAWDAPLDGGTPITGYTVTASPGGATCSAAASIGCTVAGLTNGMAYTFAVTATNVIGTGPSSDPSGGLVPGMLVAEMSAGYPGSDVPVSIVLDHLDTTNHVSVVLALPEVGGTLSADLTGLHLTPTQNLQPGSIGFSGPLVDVTTALAGRITWATPDQTGSHFLDVTIVEQLPQGSNDTPKQGATRITLRVVSVPSPTPTPVTETSPIAASPDGTAGTTITTPSGRVTFEFTGVTGTGTDPRIDVTVTPRSDDELRGRGITALGALVDVEEHDMTFEQVTVCAPVDAARFAALSRPEHRLRLLHITDDGVEHDITTEVDVDADPAVVCGIANSFSAFEVVVYAGDRIAGADRYATAAEVATELHPDGAPLVYVASGEKHPDAVVAGAAAAHDDAPLLLTTAGRLPAATVAALKELDPERIIVVGGSSAVSSEVLTALRSATGASVSRVAGADRYETAAAVARASHPNGVGQVHLATGASFPDALAAGAAAEADGGAVLLVGPDTLPASTAAALDALDPARIVVVGGESAIGRSVMASASAHADDVDRIGGVDRYATAALVAGDFPTNTDVVVATGRTFADALVATTVAGRRGAPVLLAAPDQLPAATRAAMVELEPAAMVVIGGSAAIGPRTELDLIRLLPEFNVDRL